MNALKDALGPGGWIALVAVLVGGTVRLLKADKLNALLARFGIPAIPKAGLPWLALVLGAASMAIESKTSGRTWSEAATAALAGVLSGALAVAGQETVGVATTKAMPNMGQKVFGTRTIPPPAPAPSTPPPAV